jgi:hypothetical protein
VFARVGPANVGKVKGIGLVAIISSKLLQTHWRPNENAVIAPLVLQIKAVAVDTIATIGGHLAPTMLAKYYRP